MRLVKESYRPAAHALRAQCHWTCSSVARDCLPAARLGSRRSSLAMIHWIIVFAYGEPLVTPIPKYMGQHTQRIISRASTLFEDHGSQRRELRKLRYFVNVTANEAVLQDRSEGFSDLYEACTHAVELAAELFTQYPRKVKRVISSVPLAVEVVDSRGAVIFRSPVG